MFWFRSVGSPGQQLGVGPAPPSRAWCRRRWSCGSRPPSAPSPLRGHRRGWKGGRIRIWGLNWGREGGRVRTLTRMAQPEGVGVRRHRGFFVTKRRQWPGSWGWAYPWVGQAAEREGFGVTFFSKPGKKGRRRVKVTDAEKKVRVVLRYPVVEVRPILSSPQTQYLCHQRKTGVELVWNKIIYWTKTTKVRQWPNMLCQSGTKPGGCSRYDLLHNMCATCTQQSPHIRGSW